jgi:hypothetical protein
MSDDVFFFNGIDGSNGKYVTPELTSAEIRLLARGQPLNELHQKDLENRVARDRGEDISFAPVAWADPCDLATTGWGVVFAQDTETKVRDAILDALRPLLKHRQAQAASQTDYFYQEYIHGDLIRNGKDRPCAFLPGDDKRKWLARNDAAVGQAADPEKVPYYLLLVGSPSTIPYSFQYQLDVEYGVGRLWFETIDGQPDLEAFARYACSVVEAEREPPPLARRGVFLGVHNEDDLSTGVSAPELVKPLAENLHKGAGKTWDLTRVPEEEAKKARLADLLGGKDTPTLLFTASHGMAFPTGDKRQVPHQGALLCGDWPGPRKWQKKEIPGTFYFAAEDVPDSARLLGLITFHFACYGAGTPDGDDFPHIKNKPLRSYATPKPIVARLAQRLLGHPKGGALAVIGHIERAWSCSFHGGQQLGQQLATFQSMMTQLLKGFPVGFALEYINQYHAALGTELGSMLEKMNKGWDPENLNRTLSQVWTANNDARNFVVLGDPAVKLTVGAAPEGKRREIPARVYAETGSNVARRPKVSTAESPKQSVQRPPRKSSSRKTKNLHGDRQARGSD